MTVGGWTVRRWRGAVEELHGLQPDVGAEREVWLMSPLNAALVLGSAQPAEIASAAPGDDLAAVRRRSGGGAVLVAPDDSVWIDVVIGRGDPLWDDDANRAPLWLGRAWAGALSALGEGRGEVCRRFEPGRWGMLACFLGRGPGEVLVGGAKAVGVAQRRTRTTARFQTLLYRRWVPEQLIAGLAVPPEHADGLRSALAGAIWTVAADTARIHSAFLAALP
ncbi:MAG: hypothetical protein OXF04_01990 [bacterium]|nr:hypothetical protein [bacterium]